MTSTEPITTPNISENNPLPVVDLKTISLNLEPPVELIKINIQNETTDVVIESKTMLVFGKVSENETKQYTINLDVVDLDIDTQLSLQFPLGRNSTVSLKCDMIIFNENLEAKEESNTFGPYDVDDSVLLHKSKWNGSKFVCSLECGSLQTPSTRVLPTLILQPTEGGSGEEVSTSQDASTTISDYKSSYQWDGTKFIPI